MKPKLGMIVSVDGLPWEVVFVGEKIQLAQVVSELSSRQYVVWPKTWIWSEVFSKYELFTK